MCQQTAIPVLLLTDYIVIKDTPAARDHNATSIAAEKPNPVVTSLDAEDSASSSEDELALETPHSKTQVRIMSLHAECHS